MPTRPTRPTRPANPVEELSPTVEERFRVVFVYLNALKHMSELAGEIDMPVPGFDTRQELAEWVSHMADATGLQLAAVEAVLPVSCVNLEAPLDR